MKKLFFFLFCCFLFAEEPSGYQVNFQNVSIVEYIRFASKICNVNFLYDEAELNFPVTILSEDGTSSKNVMATLLQTLQIHGFAASEQENNLLIHKATEKKELATIVTKDLPLDQQPPISTRIFSVKNANLDALANLIRPMISSYAILEVFAETRHLIITDISANIQKISELIAVLDAPQNPLIIETFTVEKNPPDYLVDLAKQILTPMTVGNYFLLLPESRTQTIFIVSTPGIVEKALSTLKLLDNMPTAQKKTSLTDMVFIYQVQHRSLAEMATLLKNMTSSLKDAGFVETGLIETLEASQPISGTHAILFAVTQTMLPKLQEVLAALDSTLEGMAKEAAQIFFSYIPINHSPKYLLSALKEVEKNLKNTPEPDQKLLDALKETRLLESTKSLLFIGTEPSINKIKQLLSTIDIPSPTTPPGAQEENFILYEPKHVSRLQIEQYLQELSKYLGKSEHPDSPLIQTVEKLKWVEESQSFLFMGPDSTLKKIQELLVQFDTPIEMKKRIYSLYHLKNRPGNVVLEQLGDLGDKLKAEKVSDPKVIEVLDKIKWVKETNSLLLSGDPSAVERVKSFIPDYDIPAMEKGNEFFMYTPKYRTAEDIEHSLKEIAQNLRKADLADLTLIQTIETMSFNPSTDSFVFTGTHDSLEKIKNLLASIDTQMTATPLKPIVWVYKVKYAPIQHLTSTLQAIGSDIRKTTVQDLPLMAALESLKLDTNTNSLIFTGSPDAIEKIKGILEKFDVPGIGAINPPSAFFVYKPVYLTGTALQDVLYDFAQQLKLSGFANPNLYEAILSTKWNDKTNTLVFTGDPASIEEIKKLLEVFDVPSKEAGAVTQVIQPIEDMSFLVYKLQYHKGDEIQGAMKKIAQDLIQTKAPVKESLLNAINSIQWIEVTNSLLCSGNQETMTRLKELIKNLDAPLKQVFIEMLVIETTFDNLLTFGLDWASKMNYKSKFSSGVSNANPADFSSGATTSKFITGMNTVNASNAPNPNTYLPVTSGFDLGVIGDIIMHKGKSFLSLGSLLNALQTDSETSIVMTPKIITQDNKKATIFIGQNIPFIGSTVTNTPQTTTTYITVGQSLEYRDVGMNLTITPIIGNTDVVTLDITLEKTDVATNAQGSSTSGTVSGITTTKTNMTTTVHIPNKNFLILSGMVTDKKETAKAGLPCLGGIPYIGAAFSKATKDIVKNNLVIFIRPHIINSYKDMQRVTESQEDFFRENSGSANLEKNFEESTEMMKSAQDYEE